MDRLWASDLCDGEGPDESGGQLTTLPPKEQITGGEPDTLADPIGGRGLAMLVGIGSISVGGLEEGKAGLIPGVLAVVDQGFTRGAGSFLLLVGKEWGMIGALKEGKSSK